MALDVDDAVRLGASAMAVQVFIGGEFETQSVHNMTRLVDEGLRRGIPVLGVTAVGKELVRDARYLGLATRICAELGAQVVKTYYCDEASAGSSPVARSRSSWPAAKLPELDALTMAWRAIDAGRRSRHGPQHLPKRRPDRDAPGGPEGGPRGLHAGPGPRGLRERQARVRDVARERLTMAGSLLPRLLAGGPRLTVGMITADLLRLGDSWRPRVAGVELVHVDVMDGVFCPMLTVGPPVIKAMRTGLSGCPLIDEAPGGVDQYVAGRT
jgi:DhnA family fructose-bisphosphate aldolase class Ia